MANLNFTLPLLRNRSESSNESIIGRYRPTSSDTLKIRTTSALFDLKMVTDLMGCSLASSLMMDAIVRSAIDEGKRAQVLGTNRAVLNMVTDE